ncbi:MAG: plasmid recombination protein [Enterococcus sp.]|nr:plasmid recombination protein [Enterococcus sp.]
MSVGQMMTVSISKGHTNESSTAHNNRKTNLEKASEEKKEAFYEQAGHKHIHAEYTYLNEDYIRNIKDVYNEQFEDAIKKYNDKQTRKNRMIGKGEALTVKEKQAKLECLKVARQYRRLAKKDRPAFLAEIKNDDIKKFIETTNKLSRRDLQKEYTKVKNAQTLGEAYYEKQRKSKQASTHVEFVVQIGSAEDFNKVDANGKIIESLDRTDPNGIWQKSKKVLEKYLANFQEQNKNLIITDSSIHMDEATPHMHLQVVPIAETDQTTARGKTRRNGLSKKVSFDGALECEGFKRDLHDSRKAFTDWQHREADTLAQIMKEDLDIDRKKGFTNRLKDVHEYKEAKRRIATLNAQTSLKSRVKHNLDKQIETAQKDKKDAEKSRDQANVQKKQAETARDNAKNDLIDAISQRDSANIELVDIQKQAEALANWNNKKEEEKRKFEEKLQKEKADQEKALQEREKAVAEREKNVASNYNAFNKMFQQFKENYMLSGLQEMSDAELENENRFDLAYNFATTTDTKSAKQFESFVFDKHPKRKIKAFMKAIASAFGRVDSINTAVLNQKEFIDEYEKENKQQMQTHQSSKQKQQENDIDDDL